MIVQDLGSMPYRDAWTIQEQLHAQVVQGDEEKLLLVEHPPVITFGRRAGVERNLLASDEQLAKLGVEVVQSDRGGDITFHGPGQIVAYPIVRLADHHLSVGGYMKRLEETVIASLAELKIVGQLDPTAIGVWVQHAGQLAKICAFGVRVRRGTTLHGLALNVTTDLRYFQLIVPCGLHQRPVTSLQQILADQCPPIANVKHLLTRHLLAAFQEKRGHS
jgi:lipoyl(octanoyl) transferase